MRFEKELENKLKSINLRYYVVFVSTFVCGLCAHLYQFTNKLFNYDELGQTPSGYGAGVSLGRWGLSLIADIVFVFFRNYSIPMINGLVTLFFVFLASCTIVKIFDVNDKVCCFLIAGILAVFPTLVATYFFMFTAPYYGMALFLSCLSAYFIIQAFENIENHSETAGIPHKCNILKLIAGIILLSLSTGIYQSYCSVTICILLMDIILRLYADKETWKPILLKGIFYCAAFVSGLIVYYICSKLAVKITGIQLDSYRGIDSMAHINIKQLVASTLRTYVYYALIMTPKDIFQINPNVFNRVTLIILNFFFAVTILARLKYVKDKISKFGLLAASAIFPVAVFFPEVLIHAEGSGLYTLMMYSVAFAFIFPVILYEKRTILHPAEQKDMAGRIISIAMLVNILVYIWFANGNYQTLQYTTYHDLAYFETLATQIKSLDGYSSDMPVAFVGDGFSDPTFKAGGLMDDYFDIEGKWPTNINYFNNIFIWKSYLGFTPEIIEFKDSGYLRENPEVKAMPHYPDEGSVAIVDGVVIIKTSD